MNYVRENANNDRKFRTGYKLSRECRINEFVCTQ